MGDWRCECERDSELCALCVVTLSSLNRVSKAADHFITVNLDCKVFTACWGDRGVGPIKM